MSKAKKAWNEVSQYLDFVLYKKAGTNAILQTDTSSYLQPFIDTVGKTINETEKMKKALKILKNYEGMINWLYIAVYATEEEKKILKEVFK